MKLTPNDFAYLEEAMNNFRLFGFDPEIDVPWLVSTDALNATIPPGLPQLTTEIGSLPGSGEQGFIQLMIDGKMPLGRFQTASPCFRPEPVVDETHLLAFFKLELIEYNPKPFKESEIWALANVVQNFYDNYLKTKIIGTEQGFDLVDSNGLELGSYGVRTYKSHQWMYGTGLALPRFTMAVNAYINTK